MSYEKEEVVEDRKVFPGKRVGNFEVIREDGRHYYKSGPYKGKRGPIKWLCKCECGNTFYRKAINILSKTSFGCKSCASKKNRWTGYGELSGDFFYKTKRGAAQRGLDFSVTIEEMWDLFILQGRRCWFTGILLTFSTSRKEQTASPDRIDNNKGYSKDNLCWVHKIVNIMRGILTPEEFVEWCHRVSEHNRRKEMARYEILGCLSL